MYLISIFDEKRQILSQYRATLGCPRKFFGVKISANKILRTSLELVTVFGASEKENDAMEVINLRILPYTKNCT